MSILHLTNEWSMGTDSDNTITGCVGVHCSCDCGIYCGWDPQHHEDLGPTYYSNDNERVLG